MHPSCSWLPPDVPAMGGRPGEGPLVRGCTVALQQASCGQQGGSGAHRRDDGCGSSPSTQPGKEGAIVNQGSRPHSTWDQDDAVTGGGIHVLGGHDHRPPDCCEPGQVRRRRTSPRTGPTTDSTVQPGRRRRGVRSRRKGGHRPVDSCDKDIFTASVSAVTSSAAEGFSASACTSMPLPRRS